MNECLIHNVDALSWVCGWDSVEGECPCECHGMADRAEDAGYDDMSEGEE